MRSRYQRRSASTGGEAIVLKETNAALVMLVTNKPTLRPHLKQAQPTGPPLVGMERTVPGWPRAIVATTTRELECKSLPTNVRF